MRWVGQLVRNGNSIQLTIKRPMLHALGWLPGEIVVSELQLDGSLRTWKLKDRDYKNHKLPKLLPVLDDAVSK